MNLAEPKQGLEVKQGGWRERQPRQTEKGAKAKRGTQVPRREVRVGTAQQKSPPGQTAAMTDARHPHALHAPAPNATDPLLDSESFTRFGILH